MVTFEVMLNFYRSKFSSVMPGFMPGIHDFLPYSQVVDGRDKPGHDVERIGFQFKGLSERLQPVFRPPKVLRNVGP
jgi:2-oxoglutarate ferredoxin oxidoreductase subunit beta